MTDAVKVIVTGDDVQRALNALAASVRDLTPAMRAVSHALARQTELNFAAEGRPKWKALADSTVKARLGGAKAHKKNGELTAAATRRQAGMKILQVSGSLAASVTPASGADYAMIGSNKVYAAIQQLGGQAGRNKATTIPARPFLPVTEQGELQPEAVPEVMETLMRYLRAAAERG